MNDIKLIEKNCSDCGMQFDAHDKEIFCQRCVDEFNSYTDEGFK